MIRHTLTIFALISFMLASTLLVLAWRSTARAEAWEVRTSGGEYWQFSYLRSTGYLAARFSLVHVRQWPEGPGTMYAIYPDQPTEIKPHTLVLLTSLSPGTYTREMRFARITLRHGRLVTLIGHDGKVIRQPPWFQGDVLSYASAPLPYWDISIPAWLATAPFLLLPGILLSRRTYGRVARRLRRRALRCQNCGYDLRASKDRCSECGMPIPAKAEAPA